MSLIQCTGKQPCAQCATGHFTCEYVPDYRRRPVPVQLNSRCEGGVSKQPSVGASDDSKEKDEDVLWKTEMLNKLQTLSEEVRQLRHATASQPNLQPNLSITMTPDSGEMLTSCNAPKTVFPGAPSILNPLGTLRDSMTNEGRKDETDPKECWMAFCSHMTDCYVRELRVWDAKIRHTGLGPVKEAAEMYFSLMNPHCKCIRIPELWCVVLNIIDSCRSLPGSGLF